MVGHYQLSKMVWEEGIYHVVEIDVVVSCLLQHRWVGSEDIYNRIKNGNEVHML